MVTHNRHSTRPGPWVLASGIAGIVVLGLGAAIGGLITYETGLEPRVETVERSQPLPDPADSETGDVAGHVFLDVEGVALTVEAGPRGEPIRIGGRVDVERLSVITSFTEDDGGPWQYVLRVHGRGVINPKIGQGAADNPLRLVLPRGMPISIRGEFENADSRHELGGLSIVDASWELLSGTHTIAFSEPLPRAVDELAVTARTADVTLSNLGNASPNRVRLANRFGNARIDLRGRWRQSADLELDCGVGPCAWYEPDPGASLKVTLLGREPDRLPAGSAR